MEKKIVHCCKICGKPLKNLIAYVPGKGEACMDCFRITAQSDLPPTPIIKTR